MKIGFCEYHQRFAQDVGQHVDGAWLCRDCRRLVRRGWEIRFRGNPPEFEVQSVPFVNPSAVTIGRTL